MGLRLIVVLGAVLALNAQDQPTVRALSVGFGRVGGGAQAFCFAGQPQRRHRHGLPAGYASLFMRAPSEGGRRQPIGVVSKKFH